MLDLEAVHPNHGYFPEADPDPVLVIPDDRLRRLRMIGGMGPISVDVDDPGVVSFEVEHGVGRVAPYLVASAERVGRTGATVHRGRNRFRLQVVVYPRHTIHVTFFFVHDKHGRPRTPESQADDEIARLNAIYGTDANVYFRWHGTRRPRLEEFDISRRMGDDEQDEMWDAFRDAAGIGNEVRHHWNVFVVRAYGVHDTATSDVLGRNKLGVNMCVVDDAGLSRPTPVLAHECGHFFTLRHTHTAGDVMIQGERKGRRLYWYQVQRLRRFLRGVAA